MHAGKGGEEDNPAAGSSGKGDKGTDKSNASLGVFGGLMKAFTPEDAHGQHLDFHRFAERGTVYDIQVMS